ncbi:hypothetical protein XFF4834R_chr06280 [Xanthomonas citri pv. fuscans]|nr:hypothetical protein XFF4834R_chr06280 [Xanthomonas citri pv. fuscans]
MQCDVAWHAAGRASPTLYDQDALKPLRCTISPGCKLTSQLILKNRPLKERTPRTVFVLPHEDRAADYAAPTERNPNRLQPSADAVTAAGWAILLENCNWCAMTCNRLQRRGFGGALCRCVRRVGARDWLVALNRLGHCGVPAIAVVGRTQGLRQPRDWSSLRRPYRSRQLIDGQESGSSHVAFVC